MNLFAEAFAWLFSPERLQGSYALQILLGQHLYYTIVSVLIAVSSPRRRPRSGSYLCERMCRPLIRPD